MEKQGMIKILSYKDERLMLGGVYLNDIANMYNLSVREFLKLFSIYLNFTREYHLDSKYIINNTESIMFLPNVISGIKKISGEILVSEENYDYFQRLIFDFAYTKCSNYGVEYFDFFEMSNTEAWESLFRTQLTKPAETYSCIYRSSDGNWDQKVSDLVINKVDQEKMYALVQKNKNL